MKKTLLKKKSGKQIIRDTLWQRIKFARAQFLHEKYDRVICEYCGRPAWGNELGIIDAHHIDCNRRNNTEENCVLLHRLCHAYVHQEKITIIPLGFQGIMGNDRF